MEMKLSELFQLVVQQKQRGDIMSKLTKKQLEELEALKNMSDEEIDTSDIPEIQDWSQAKIGQFYRPVKKQITMRLDADVIAWLQADGKGYQTRANEILRGVMGSNIPIAAVIAALPAIAKHKSEARD